MTREIISSPKFAGKTHLGRYSDSMLELDDNIGRVVDAIRTEAPDTIVIVTADNGAWPQFLPRHRERLLTGVLVELEA